MEYSYESVSEFSFVIKQEGFFAAKFIRNLKKTTQLFEFATVAHSKTNISWKENNDSRFPLLKRKTRKESISVTWASNFICSNILHSFLRKIKNSCKPKIKGKKKISMPVPYVCCTGKPVKELRHRRKVNKSSKS